MMVAVVYLSSKLGQVAGKGLFDVIRDHYPRWVLQSALHDRQPRHHGRRRQRTWDHYPRVDDHGSHFAGTTGLVCTWFL
jgi:hypothetical protein